jgi:nucleoside 2-deoxyribosyltransferase
LEKDIGGIVLMAYKVYFAGDLFDQKHITGNLLLSKNIEKLCNGLYKCVLPQDWEGATFDNSIDIRNKDFKSVMLADLILFNFDGVDLDSGTVAEFMFAKMLDIPAVLLRTDVRNGGYLFGDDWNLMLSGFPRCVVVKNSALELFNDFGLEKTQTIIARSIIDAFNEVLKKEPLLKSYEEIFSAYRFVSKMCGSRLDKIISDKFLHELVTAKMDKKIYKNNRKLQLRYFM